MAFLNKLVVGFALTLILWSAIVFAQEGGESGGAEPPGLIEGAMDAMGGMAKGVSDTVGGALAIPGKIGSDAAKAGADALDAMGNMMKPDSA